MRHGTGEKVMSHPFRTVCRMDMPTPQQLHTSPDWSLQRLREIRVAVEEAEMTAIASWMRRGGTLSGLAFQIGVSRQSLNQRLQRRLKTRQPTVVLKEQAEMDLTADIRRVREETIELLRAGDRRRAAAAAAAEIDRRTRF